MAQASFPASTGAPRVLIVNDDVALAEELCALFESTGAQVEIALGAVGAAHVWLRLDPDIVVISELRAGGDDGCAVAQWFARLERGASRPLYVCVAERSVSPLRQQYLATGFDLCLVQPVSAAMAEHVVRLVTEGRFDRRQRAPAASALPLPLGESLPSARV